MLVPKLFTCLKNYSKEQFIKDLIAGIIVAIIALPLSIALAIASGVSPEKGLHTAIVGGFFIALLGGSRVQIGGPTGAFVIIVLGILEKHGMVGLTVTTIIAGLFLILAGFLKFGSMIKYIPYPIITGFNSGIAVTVFSTQIKDFFGLTITDIPSGFIQKWTAYFQGINTINYAGLLIGGISLAIVIFWPKVNKKIPSTLVAIIVATIATIVFGLNIETIGSRFGNISSALPSISIPRINLKMIEELIFPGITIGVLVAVESLLSAVVSDGMIGGKHRSNMELVAQGTANIFSALFGGIPVTGAIARSAANVKNGGRTPVAGIVYSIVLLIIMLLFMPYVKLVPMASLAAILIVVFYNMAEWEAFKKFTKTPKSDATVFIVTFTLTVLLDLVVAIGVGLVLACFLFMKRMADVTSVKSILDDEEQENDLSDLLSEVRTPEDISYYEINGPFFFGAADKFVNVVKEISVTPKVLIIKMSKVPAMDATALNGLEMLQRICKRNKTEIILLQLQEQPYKTLEKAGFLDAIGIDNVCESVDNAISRAQVILEKRYRSKNEVAI